MQRDNLGSERTLRGKVPRQAGAAMGDQKATLSPPLRSAESASDRSVQCARYGGPAIPFESLRNIALGHYWESMICAGIYVQFDRDADLN